MLRPLLAAAALIVVAGSGDAQMPVYAPPYAQMPLPYPQQAPAASNFAGPWWPNPLYVRFAGPAGVKITIFRGPKAEILETPCTVGLRPGYRYRVQVSGMPQFPGVVLTPTLEVRGCLRLANPNQAVDFPVGLFFGAEDFAKVDAGGFITKVAVVEPPDQAIPQAATVEQPLEIRLLPNRDAFVEAKNRGRAVLVAYVGPRQTGPEELATANTPGTILLPGEKTLILPPVPPYVTWAWVFPNDPLLGPRHPNEELKLINGGDRPLEAGFGPGGKLVGVDPADTVAEYVDSRGRRRIACSNRVALCIPRYIIVRGETYPGEQVALFGPGVAHAAKAGIVFTAPQPVLTQHQNVHPEGIYGRQKPTGTEQTVGTAITGRINGLLVTATLRPTGNITGACPPPAIVEPEGCLKIDKWPDRCGGLVGEILTFTLRYTNTGGQPMSGIVLTDSLITRFEYVPGSAKTDREAIFTTQPNDAGSMTLRWEFAGVLPPGQHGMVTFQVRIR